MDFSKAHLKDYSSLSDRAKDPLFDEDEADEPYDIGGIAHAEADNWATFGVQAVLSGQEAVFGGGFGDDFSSLEKVTDYFERAQTSECRLSVATLSDDSDFLDCESLNFVEEKEDGGSIRSSSSSDYSFYSFESINVEIDERIEVRHPPLTQEIEGEIEGLELHEEQEKVWSEGQAGEIKESAGEENKRQDENDSVSSETSEDSDTIENEHRIERVATEKDSDISEIQVSVTGDNDRHNSDDLVRSETSEDEGNIEELETEKDNAVCEIQESVIEENKCQGINDSVSSVRIEDLEGIENGLRIEQVATENDSDISEIQESVTRDNDRHNSDNLVRSETIEDKDNIEELEKEKVNTVCEIQESAGEENKHQGKKDSVSSVRSEDSDAIENGLLIEGLEKENDYDNSVLSAFNETHNKPVLRENLDLGTARVDDTGEGAEEVENATKETSRGEDSVTLFTIESARKMFKKWKADRVPSHELVYSIDIPREDPRMMPSDGSTSRSR